MQKKNIDNITNINNLNNINNIIDNRLNNTMFNIQPQNALNSNSFMVDNNRIQHKQNIINNTLNLENNSQSSTTNLLQSNYNINNYLGMFTNSQNIDDDNDFNNLKTLDEFKKLLRKMDKRLEAPIIKKS